MKKGKIVQGVSLVLFISLIILGKVQLWMAIFGGSLLLSTYFGRFYCGYICPINTGMEIIDGKANKEKRKRKSVPDLFKKPIIRYGILALFLGTMVIVFKTGKKLPVLPALFSLGLIITYFYRPEFWHRYLCPYGSLLSVFSRYNKKSYEIVDESCNNCGRCVRICPSHAISWEDRKEKPIIIGSECLQCGKCQDVCLSNAINKL